MKRLSLLTALVTGLLTLSMMAGCAHWVGEGSDTAIVATSEAFKQFSGEYENTGYFKKNKPTTIAVLPFSYSEKDHYQIDDSPSQNSGIVRRGMYNHLASLPFRDQEIYDTDRRLKTAALYDIRDIQRLIAEAPQQLKRVLDVDAVVSGDVTHFDRYFFGLYSQVAVGCEVKMWDLSSGQLLWRAKQVSRAHGGGVSISPTGLVMSAIAAMWNLRESELYSQTDDLFREMVSTIDAPQSGLASRPVPPRIDLFAALNSHRPLTAGQRVAFRLVGDPNCRAFVELPGIQSTIALQPLPAERQSRLGEDALAAVRRQFEAAGDTFDADLQQAVQSMLKTRQVYEGLYTIGPNQQGYGIYATVRLVNPAGHEAKAIDPVNAIDIDSLPPGTPHGAIAQPLDKRIHVRWTPNVDNDLVGYEVWTSATPLSGFELAQRTEQTEAILEDQTNFSKVYVKVRAVDRASNTGAFSEPIKARALPNPKLQDFQKPGPVLGGVLASNALLVADKNPYTITDTLRVVTGGMLAIAPGVRLVFSPGAALEVDGGDLMAYGDQQQHIYFVARNGKSRAGSWPGIVLKNSAKSLMQYAVISNAVTGVMVFNSAPHIDHVTVEKTSQAGLVLGNRARPMITCSVISDNSGQGGIILEGEGLSPVFEDNVFRDNDPFHVQNYTPIRIDLTRNYWGVSEPSPDWFLGDVIWRPFLRTPPHRCRNKSP